MKKIVYFFSLIFLISIAYAIECQTVGTKMYTDYDGTGYIGCDIIVEGNFDLNKSYCIGMTSGKKEYLKPNNYGMPDQYYATLVGLDLKEEVKVFVYDDGEIECLPPLNRKSCFDDDGKDFYTKGKTKGLYIRKYDVYEDYCEYNTVVEFYCWDELDIVSKDFEYCVNGCQDGACNSEHSNDKTVKNSSIRDIVPTQYSRKEPEEKPDNFIEWLIWDIKKDLRIILQLLGV